VIKIFAEPLLGLLLFDANKFYIRVLLKKSSCDKNIVIYVLFLSTYS